MTRWWAATTALLLGCSPNTKFAPSEPPTPCTTTADCAPGEACDGFDVDSGTPCCVACSSSTRSGCCKPDGGGPPADTPCTSDSDCSSNQQCVFVIGHCPGSATCQENYCGACPVFSLPYCTCDGKTVYLGCSTVPSGYATSHIAAPGECAVVDAGVPDGSDD